MLYKTLKVPFECVAKIEYCTSPVFKTSNGFIPVALPDKENSPEDSYFSGERLFCELDEASICESNVERKNYFRGLMPGKIHLIPDGIFGTVNNFTLLQWQQVRIPGYFQIILIVRYKLLHNIILHEGQYGLHNTPKCTLSYIISKRHKNIT